MSMASLISLAVLLASGAVGYGNLRYMATANAADLKDLPESVARLEVRMTALTVDQEKLQEKIDDAASESRQADAQTLAALSDIAVAIGRIQQQLDDQ